MKSTASPSNNLYFVNVTKTIGVFLMSLADLPIPSSIYSFINSFHMPLFFILSGYLLSINTISFKPFLVKKIKTLLIPLELAAEYWEINIIYTILVFIFLSPIIYLINRYTPFLLGRKQGIM